MRTSTPLALLAAAVTAFGCSAPQPPAKDGATPGFNTKIPPSIMTPDQVETRLGTLRFFDGFPTAETSALVYDNLDFIRGVEVFLQLIPAASIEAIRLGSVGLGAKASNQAVIYDQLLDSNPLLLTGNTDTVYCIAMMDLEADGPTVVEIPPGCGPGTVNDAYFRFVIDMGIPGPDAGKGGKYLILPPGHKGDAPEGYFAAKSPSYTNLLVLRGFLVDGKPDAASKMFREQLKIYPLAKAANPPAMQFFNGSKLPFNTIHANNFDFYAEIDHALQKEPAECFGPEVLGLLSSIGFRKGRKFAPDERLKKTLVEAVAVGNATARAISYSNRDPQARIYPDAQWKQGFIGGDYRWLIDQGAGGLNFDARVAFFYQATVNTPAMAAKMIGKGSQYALASADKNGRFLDGSKSYRLRVPANVPAKDFWSVVLYDPQTRSELQTSQPFPSKNNRRDKLATNADGSVDLYFGPQAPAGKEASWIQTVPGKGWFTIFRLYGPLEPWFEKTWRLTDIEEGN